MSAYARNLTLDELIKVAALQDYENPIISQIVERLDNFSRKERVSLENLISGRIGSYSDLEMEKEVLSDRVDSLEGDVDSLEDSNYALSERIKYLEQKLSVYEPNNSSEI